MTSPWSWARELRPLGKLESPPIKEVICGFLFDPVALDPVVIGEYARERRDQFPKHQLQPAIEAATEPGFVIQFAPIPPLRVWLLSADESLLLQVQRDRFYVNWRSRGGDYPRFTGGLRERTIAELEKFADFAERAIGSDLRLRQLEFGKVDHMLEGETWNGTGDLATMLPALAPFLSLSAGTMPAVSIRFDDRVQDAVLTCKIDTTLALQRANPHQPVRGVKLETQVILPLTAPPIAEHLDLANTIVNAAFARFIPEKERIARFGGLS